MGLQLVAVQHTQAKKSTVTITGTLGPQFEVPQAGHLSHCTNKRLPVCRALIRFFWGQYWLTSTDMHAIFVHRARDTRRGLFSWSGPCYTITASYTEYVR